jgi:hypothetical protein
MSQQSSYRFTPFLIWLFANILGFGALVLLTLVSPFLMSIKSIVVSTLVISLPISVAQWLALRRISKTSVLWILTIPIGLLLALLLLRSIPSLAWLNIDDESLTVLTAGIFLIGFMIGLPQWLILRHQFTGSWLWLLGSTLAVTGGFWLIVATDLINHSGFFALVVGLFVYIVTTGLILSRLLASNRRAAMEIAGPG